MPTDLNFEDESTDVHGHPTEWKIPNRVPWVSRKYVSENTLGEGRRNGMTTEEMQNDHRNRSKNRNLDLSLSDPKLYQLNNLAWSDSYQISEPHFCSPTEEIK